MNLPILNLILLLFLSLPGFASGADQSIVLSHVAVSKGEVTLRWEGGKPPFSIESSTEMEAWTELVKTDETSVVVSPGNGGVHFLRVVSSSQEPELGEYIGQLRVDEGEFGDSLARHRLKSLWDFHLPLEETRSRIPEEYFKALVMRLDYREGTGLETFVGKFETCPARRLTNRQQSWE